MMRLFFIFLFLTTMNLCFSQTKTDTTKNGFFSYSNVMTPNNDGKQDTWSFDYIVQPDSFKLTIYNRWGNVLFETSKVNFVWDGTDDKKKKIPTGIYMFKAELYYNEQKKSFTGSINLIQ